MLGVRRGVRLAHLFRLYPPVLHTPEIPPVAVTSSSRALAGVQAPEFTNENRGDSKAKRSSALLFLGCAASLASVFCLRLRRVSAQESEEQRENKNQPEPATTQGDGITGPASAMSQAPARGKKRKQGEKRFREFASLEYNGVALMTPRDFLDSVIQERPRPRIKSKILSNGELARIHKLTPVINKYVSVHKSENPVFLRALADNGVILFHEYLFLLSVLTRPESGFRIAFDLIDTARENVITKIEFSQFVLLASASPRDSDSSKVIPTVESTLSTHFFGKSGSHKLTLDEFSSFIHGMQREVLKAEFLEYSRGLDRISEEDFTSWLLRYTDLSEQEQNKYFSRLEQRLAVDDRPGLSFADLEQFFFLLNNISDFMFAFRLYPHAGRALSKQEFSRAAKISLSGNELAENLVDVIFALFDDADDNSLAYDEFFVIVKNRLHRQVRRSIRRTGFRAFKQCVREESVKAV